MRVPTKGEPVCETAARLVLAGTLIWAAESGMATSGWSDRKWEQVLAALDNREAVVVLLHAVRGLTFLEISQWLGVSRGRTDQLWRRAVAKLRAHDLTL
jgi:DNA-directed RNA polymerase specialized sigma24 family protein